MRVGMLVASASRSAGGVHTSLQALSGALQDLGAAVTVFAIEDEHTADDLRDWPVEVRAFPGQRRLGYSRALHRDLRAAPLDLLHAHGIWKLTDAIALDWRRRTGRPLVLSTHGMVDAWALRQGRARKLVAGLLYTRPLLARAGCLHALCDEERVALRGLGARGPVAVIPNGVALPDPGAPAPGPDGRKVLLFLGRLHPKKGVAPLIEGWAQACRAEPGLARTWSLAIHGWGDDAYVDELRRRAAAVDPGGSVRVLGPAYREEKAALFRAAAAFALPSLSEGFPIAILEAWSFGLPVLMTERCNMAAGFEAGAALRAEPAPADLARAILALSRLPDEERARMGQRGRELVARRFQWSAIGRDFLRTYEWLLGAGPRPEVVQPGEAER